MKNGRKEIRSSETCLASIVVAPEHRVGRSSFSETDKKNIQKEVQMNVFEAIKTRRSIRSFDDRPIEEEKLLRVLEAGRLAPSAKNRQEWRYVVVKDKELKKKLAVAANNQYFMAEAPVIIVGCATLVNYVLSCGQPAYTIDVSISMDHITLQAVEEGLGTCWIGAFKEDEVKKILNIPEDIRVVELLPLGYPKFHPEPKPRKRLDEIVFYDRWQ